MANRTKFPSGTLAPVAKYVESKGLQLGIYTADLGFLLAPSPGQATIHEHDRILADIENARSSINERSDRQIQKLEDKGMQLEQCVGRLERWSESYVCRKPCN